MILSFRLTTIDSAPLLQERRGWDHVGLLKSQPFPQPTSSEDTLAFTELLHSFGFGHLSFSTIPPAVAGTASTLIESEPSLRSFNRYDTVAPDLVIWACGRDFIPSFRTRRALWFSPLRLWYKPVRHALSRDTTTIILSCLVIWRTRYLRWIHCPPHPHRRYRYWRSPRPTHRWIAQMWRHRKSSRMRRSLRRSGSLGAKNYQFPRPTCLRGMSS